MDGGSSNNLISKEDIKKLKLPLKPHPNPYMVAWFSKGNAIPIITYCLVKFSMGRKFHDDVWCDVFEMDAFNVLVGRLWLYDHDMVHYIYSNTYSL